MSMIRNFDSMDREYSESLGPRVMKILVQKYRNTSFTKSDVKEEEPTISPTNIDRLIAFLIRENQVIPPEGSSRNASYKVNMSHETCATLLVEVEQDEAEMEAAKVLQAKKQKKQQKQQKDVAENDENSSNGEQKRSSTAQAMDTLLNNNHDSSNKRQRMSPSTIDSLQHLSHHETSTSNVEEKEEEENVEEEVDEEAEMEKELWQAKVEKATEVLMLAMADDDSVESNTAYEFVQQDMTREEFDDIVTSLADRNIVMVCDGIIMKI